MKKILLALLMVSVLPAAAWAKSTVFVSILPQREFVRQIAGDLVNVEVMVMPGASPATYEPRPKQMAALSKSKLYLAIGVPFENTWLKRFEASNPNLRIVHTDEGIKKIEMAEHHHDHEGEEHHHDHGDKHHEDHDHHDHGEKHHGEEHHHDHAAAHHDEHEKEHEHHEGGHEEGHHHHGGLDPHVWLAPYTVQTVARNTADALIKLDPANKAAYEQGFASFMKAIGDVDHEIHEIIHDIPKGRRSFMVFHPSWGYFAHQYGLEQIAIEFEGKEPGPKRLMEIAHHGKELDVPVVFVQPQFSKKSAQVIAREMGAQVTDIDPLAEDWADNMLRVAQVFRDALR